MRSRRIQILLLSGAMTTSAALAVHAGNASSARRTGPPAAEAPDAVASATATRVLLDKPYRLEARVSFHAALLHWLDSLADLSGYGLTAGKTVAAHRHEFLDVLGEPTPQDAVWLRGYAEARLRQAAAEGSGKSFALAFFEAPDLATALDAATALVSDDDAVALRGALEHYAGRYRAIWREGAEPERFLDSAARRRWRRRLGRFLADVARFYGVALPIDPTPTLILTPVRAGHGTHAQAIEHALLVEIRPLEDFADEVPPIVHENSHFLFYRIASERRDALRRATLDTGPDGEETWELLGEALPTAIAQGVAARRFAPRGWSTTRPWYHRPEIDAYAKRLLPLVERALDQDEPFDERFVSRAAALRD